MVIGTHNRDKLRELKRLLDGSGIEVLSLDDAGRRIQEAVEDGRTYEANARKKASFYAKQTGLLTLADDSGLSVASLRGRPGVYSARFAGSGCTYQDNNQKLLRLLSKKPPRSRKAK
ncbi:MAG: non-canonical purine NTP pyrophosphatase, partial [Candidatus Omnitrophota bacterium]